MKPTDESMSPAPGTPGFEAGSKVTIQGTAKLSQGGIDLADELKDELSRVKVPAQVDPQVRQALELLREGTKEGLTPTDHHDLGVAYMGMGLVDDAVREFNAARGLERVGGAKKKRSTRIVEEAAPEKSEAADVRDEGPVQTALPLGDVTAVRKGRGPREPLAKTRSGARVEAASTPRGRAQQAVKAVPRRKAEAAPTPTRAKSGTGKTLPLPPSPLLKVKPPAAKAMPARAKVGTGKTLPLPPSPLLKPKLPAQPSSGRGTKGFARAASRPGAPSKSAEPAVPVKKPGRLGLAAVKGPGKAPPAGRASKSAERPGTDKAKSMVPKRQAQATTRPVAKAPRRK